MATLVFSEEMKEDIIKKVLGKDIDKEGFIIEKNGDRVLSSDAEEIHLDDFGGFSEGEFIKSDVVSLMKFSERKRE